MLEMLFGYTDIGTMTIESDPHPLEDAAPRKKKSQNGSPRRAVWSSITQLSVELNFGALYNRPHA